jgi:hypothetical protein
MPRGPDMIFEGNVAVMKRLKSAGMLCSKVEIYRRCKTTWEATTDHGKRWVSYTSTGWRIFKAPPAPAEVSR